MVLDLSEASVTFVMTFVSRGGWVMRSSSTFIFSGLLLAAGWRERRDGERGE